jgi:hypothetical protein
MFLFAQQPFVHIFVYDGPCWKKVFRVHSRPIAVGTSGAANGLQHDCNKCSPVTFGVLTGCNAQESSPIAIQSDWTELQSG